MNRLLAYSLIRGIPYPEQVEMLNYAGYATKEIADMTGKTSKNVSQTLWRIKKKRADAESASEEVTEPPTQTEACNAHSTGTDSGTQ